MLIRVRQSWELKESAVTPEAIALDRRRFLGATAAGLALAPGIALAQRADADASARLYPFPRSEAFKLDREITPETLNLAYNNFYEFGASKKIARAAEALKTRPWTIKVEGLVDKPFEIDLDDLIQAMPREERLYRHRCVETWAMAVAWSGFPLRAFLDRCKPLASAKYVAFDTFLDPKIAPAQKASWYPWPYSEGLTIAEAANDLAFMAIGAYGKPLAKQMGAPIRLALPWKYGFKSIKSIVRLRFLEQRPMSFWQKLQPEEYGFWANVNPAVPHPRWSQASEEILGTGRRVPTQLYNGYAEAVASLYEGVKGERLFL